MLLSTVHAAAFSDTAGHWAEETLTAWQEQGRIDGYSDGSFHPDASVTKNVQFIWAGNAAYTALKAAVTRAEPYSNPEKFGSQTACDNLTVELTAAVDGIGNLTVMTGKNYTAAYVRAQIKKWLDSEKANQTEWAIGDAAWPLKSDHGTYTIPEKTENMQLSADGTKNAVALTWTIEASDWDWKDCLEIAKDSKDGVKSVRVTQAPAAPEDITFRVSALTTGKSAHTPSPSARPSTLRRPSLPRPNLSPGGAQALSGFT